MKGQASVEGMLVLATVLALAAGFIYIGQSATEPINAVSAGRTGAENAITGLKLTHNVEIEINNINHSENMIKIELDFWGEDIAKNSIEENVRTEALKFIYQAFNGTFPDTAHPVSTAHNTFDVSVTVERVKK